MTDSVATSAEPACPAGGGTLRAVSRPFAAIAPAAWDALAAASPWATPFSRWAVHRAWWDAYGANAHDQTTVLVPADAADDAPPVAIVPLMHRHAVEPDDAILHTSARAAGGALTPVAPNATVVYFGASYHADYATILAAPGDLPAAATALAESCDVGGSAPAWDVIDLRRLRTGDPAAEALTAAFQARGVASGWAFTREQEDVCPVVTLPPGADFEAYLGALSKKERHEVRRKIRRAESTGKVRLEAAAGTEADRETFIDLHQKRWGADGLFPETPGGVQSRVFIRRLFELGIPEGFVHLRFVTVDGNRIAAGVTFEDATTSYFYNAGIEPAARELSPGVLLSALSIRGAIEAGKTRFDYLRGDEGYKYEWGAVDEPIQRLLVVRTS